MNTDLFRRVRKPCASPYGCHRKVETLLYVKRPVCRRCRKKARSLANLKLGRQPRRAA